MLDGIVGAKEVTMSEIVPDHIHAGAFVVRAGVTEQSWIDLDDPTRIEFEYVQRIVEALRATVLARPASQRIRVVHIGGGGLSLPRYVAAVRPRTAQIVIEPDSALVAAVREQLPLPRNSGIKIRELDGRTAAVQLPDDYADALIVDAFRGAVVPAELATLEWFAELARIVRGDGVMVMNLGDRAPFDWGRRCLAGIAATFGQVAVSAEIPVWKGRRYGNLVAVAASDGLPLAQLERDLARAPFPYRLLATGGLTAWLGGAPAFTDEDSADSLDPVAHGWLS
jgi:spermidine synthase